MTRPYSLSVRYDSPPEPDRALLARYAGGDPAAFGALLDRHGPLVLGVCRRVLGPASPLADDAFQATFLVLAKKAAHLRDPDTLPGWLFGVARRVAAAARRKDVIQEKAARAAARPAAVPPPGEWDDLLAVVDDEIAKLPGDQRAAVLLCLYHGKTQDEAAAELGWSVSTLRRRLDDGRDLLRSRLTTRGVAPAAAVVAGAVAPSAVTAVTVELRAAALDLAAGGAVAARLGGLTRGELPRVSGVGVALAAGGVVVAAGMVAFGAGAFDRPPPAAAGGKSPPLMADVDHLPDAPEPPLPTQAALRLGTTRLRPGTGGAVGLSDPAGLTKLVFLPDGTLASVGGPRVRFWDTTTGVQLHADGPVIPGDGWAGLRAVPFDRGRKLFVPDTDANGTLRQSGRVWDLTSRTAAPPVAFARHPGRKGDVLGPTAVSADGSRFFQADGNGAGWVWHADGSPGAKLAGPVRDHGVAAFLPGGAELVTSCPDGRFRVWDAAAGGEVRAFGGPPAAFAAAASADGRYVAVVGFVGDPADALIDPELVVWDATTGGVHRSFPAGDLAANVTSEGGTAAFTPDGRHVVLATHTAARDRVEVRWWALAGDEAGRWAVRSGGCGPFPLAASDGPGLVAVGSGEPAARGVIRLFDGRTGREWVADGAMTGPVRVMRFEGNELQLQAGGRYAVWDVATGARLRNAIAPPPPLRVTPNLGFDFHAATGTAAPVGPPAPGKRVVTVTAAAESRDGRRVAFGAATLAPGEGFGRVYVVDRAGPRVAWEAAVPDAGVTAVAFSPDGSKVAVGSTVVRLFAADGTPGPTLDGHRGAVTALAFTADGKRLASGGTDATAVVWDVD